MRDISQKSFGFLVDELITAWMKVGAGQKDAIARRDALQDYLETNYKEAMDSRSIDKVISELKKVSWQCFQAQDSIMSLKDPKSIANAAVSAQKMNSERNRLIRVLDDAVGESDITVLGKTYG